MADFLIQPMVLWALRIFLALLFVTAALSKLRHVEEFYGVVRNFRLLPDGASRVVALVLPVVEAAVAAGLVVTPLAAPAAITAAGLLLVFAAALAINVLRGRTQIDCGCFRNGLKQPVSWLLVLRNLVLTGLALAVAAGLPAAAPASPVEGATGLLAGATAMLIYLSASLLGGLSAAQTANKTAKGR